MAKLPEGLKIISMEHNGDKYLTIHIRMSKPFYDELVNTDPEYDQLTGYAEEIFAKDAGRVIKTAVAAEREKVKLQNQTKELQDADPSGRN